jgi:hypothetical protein
VVCATGQKIVARPANESVIVGLAEQVVTRWVSCKPGFFLPVRVLSRLFRRLFLQYLDAAFAAGELQFLSTRHSHAACHSAAGILGQDRARLWNEDLTPRESADRPAINR